MTSEALRHQRQDFADQQGRAQSRRVDADGAGHAAAEIGNAVQGVVEGGQRRLQAREQAEPASVGETLRVVRWSRRRPSRSSRARIAWLKVEGAVPSSSAAPRKLRWVATATKAVRSLSDGLDIAGDLSAACTDFNA